MSLFTGLISAELKQLHEDAITEVVTGCAIPCTLIYGQTKTTDCPNCIYDPIGNKSSNRYQTGGPSPFNGICPICFGVGRLPEQASVSIDLCVIYDYKKWLDVGLKTNTPNGYVQTLSLISTIDDIKQAKELIVDTTLESTIRQRFERDGEPHPCGLGQSTILATMWKRIEN